MKNEVIEKIKEILQDDERVIFAYLYGSYLKGEKFNDIDIGIYIRNTDDILSDLADIRLNISQYLCISPEKIDIHIINNTSNLFLLRDVLNGLLLVDKDTNLRGDFIESFSMRFREAEGILDEAYS